MDQDRLKLLNVKIEKTLELARVLKSEKADLEAVIAGLHENLKEKDKIIEDLEASKEQLAAEIRSMQEALKERDEKLEEAEDALLQNIDALDRMLGASGDSRSQDLFNMQEGNT
jgi:chromosome segregation ATPase